jgi:hypothetical protein
MEESNMSWYDEDDRYDREDMFERFADPYGESALYASGKDNPRNLPCPTCKWPNRLTRKDRQAGYQCDSCANAMERGGEINYYEAAENDEEFEREDDDSYNDISDDSFDGGY